MGDAVTVEYGDGVIEITINRPEARNALNGAVRTGVTEALTELDRRDDLAIAILTGAGGTFSAGMDLKAFLAGELSGEPGRGMAGLTPVQPRKPVIAEDLRTEKRFDATSPGATFLFALAINRQ